MWVLLTEIFIILKFWQAFIVISNIFLQVCFFHILLLTVYCLKELDKLHLLVLEIAIDMSLELSYILLNNYQIFMYIYMYLHSKDGVVRLWHPLVNLYIWLTILSCYGSIPLALGLIGRDGGLSTLCHSCGFACQQRVLKTFPGSGYLHSKDGYNQWLH